MKKGDIVLLPFPFTDLSGVKNRPGVILHVHSNDDIVAFISSQTQYREKTDVYLEPTSQNGLKKKSLIRVRKIVTITKDFLLGKLGELNDRNILELDNALIKVFNIQN